VHWENTYKDAYSIRHNTTYTVKFRVRGAAIKPGQVIGVLGSLPELDKWRQQAPFSHILKWQSGDIWESEEPLVTSKYFFHYKYCVIKQTGDGEKDHVVAWERGVDRVADLEIMPDESRETFNPTDSFVEVEYERSHAHKDSTK
jgi:hypothetical protein